MDLSELGIGHYSFYKGWLRWRWSKLSKIVEIFARMKVIFFCMIFSFLAQDINWIMYCIIGGIGRLSTDCRSTVGR